MMNFLQKKKSVYLVWLKNNIITFVHNIITLL